MNINVVNQCTVLTHLLEKIISRRQSLDYKPNNATCKIKTEVQFLSKQWQPIDPKKKSAGTSCGHVLTVLSALLEK